jgi:hypothetical protein
MRVNKCGQTRVMNMMKTNTKKKNINARAVTHDFISPFFLGLFIALLQQLLIVICTIISCYADA